MSSRSLDNQSVIRIILLHFCLFELEEEESKAAAAAAGPTWGPGQLLQAGAASASLSSQLLLRAADTEQLAAHKGGY